MPKAHSVTGGDLPDDLWRIVACYIPGKSVFQFISVHRTFLHVALGRKYGVIRWTKLDRNFVHVLNMLQSPLVAIHVQKLYIRAWFIEYLLKRSVLFGKPASKFRLPTSERAIKFWDLLSSLNIPKRSKRLNHLSNSPGEPGVDEKSKEGNLVETLSPKQILSLMAIAIEGMTNATALDFEWRDLSLNKDSSVFLTTTRKAFGRSLRKLALQAPIAMFKELLAIADFPHLDELSFNFDYVIESTARDDASTKRSPVDASTESQELLSTLVPFIAHRRSSLRTLHISSSSSSDLSLFFLRLPDMPVLRRLDLEIHFHKSRLIDPSGILKILQTPSLLHVRLKPPATMNYYSHSGDGRGTTLTRKDNSWEQIILRILRRADCLRHLESLELPFLSLETTLPLIRRSSDTLTRLTLTNKFLSFSEVSEVVHLFHHRPFDIQHLHLEVDSLQLPLFRLLALHVPNLHSLELVCNVIVGTPDDIFPDDIFDYAPFKDWQLYDLGIYLSRYQPPGPEASLLTGVNTVIEGAFMNRISRAVPSIVKLKGVEQLSQSEVMAERFTV